MACAYVQLSQAETIMLPYLPPARECKDYGGLTIISSGLPGVPGKAAKL